MLQRSAPRTFGLRAGIVGGNFGIMVGLAALLGLDAFGQLAFIWGAALMASTVLSLGGPLILLRSLTDGGGMRQWDVLGYAIFYPCMMAAGVIGPLTWIFPTIAWEAILFGGLAINLLFCLASAMRALGSVQMSMGLRDAGPQVALGLAALAAGHLGPAAIIHAAAVIMGVLGAFVVFWCLSHAGLQAILTHRRQRWDGSLYGTSVLGMGLSQVDLLIGGAVLPGEAFGLYALLRRIANLVALPVSVATWVSAAAISGAFGAGDMRRLADASARGSQIALYPGTVLFVVGLCALPFVSLIAADAVNKMGEAVFAVLLLGAFGQVLFASSYTVATLCGLARYTVLARLCVIMCYGVIALMIGPDLSILSNALAYVAALSFGGVTLWWHVRRELGIDTSALVTWRGREKVSV